MTLCAMNDKMTIWSLILVLLLAVAGCASREPSPKPQPTTEEAIPSEFRGVVATIRSLGGAALSAQPLRLQHTLKNTTDKPIVIHDLDNARSAGCENGWQNSSFGFVVLVDLNGDQVLERLSYRLKGERWR